MFLHVLKGIQAGSYIQLSDNSTYRVANNLDADIYLETENNQLIGFTFNVFGSTLDFSELNCSITTKNQLGINIEQQYITPLECSVGGEITLLFSDLDREQLLANSHLNKLEVDSDNLSNNDIEDSELLNPSILNAEINSEEILAEVRQKILDRSLFLKIWDKLRLYFYHIKQRLGYWLYLASFGLVIFLLAIIIIVYQLYQQDNIANHEESKFNFKHKIEQLIQTLPGKFNNFYITNQDGELIVNGVVKDSKDLQQVNDYFKLYQPNLKIKIVVFDNIKSQIVKVLADNNISMPMVSFDVNTATVNLMGLTDSMEDIDNAEIAIDNKYPGMGQMNANKVLLIKDINAVIDEIFNSASLSQSLTINKDFIHGVVLVSGYLSPSELNNLNNIVTTFNQKYYPLVKMKVNVKNVFKSLPFKITEVFSGGDQSWIVTDDGTRIFEGGSYKGFSVASISSDSVVLKGKFTLTISTSQLALDSFSNNIVNDMIIGKTESAIFESKEMTNFGGVLNESSNSN